MQRRHARCQFLVIALALSFSAARSGAAAAPRRAFETDAPAAAAMPAKRDPAVARERHVRLPTSFAESLGRTEHRAVLNLFDNAEHVFIATRSRVSLDGVTTVEGELEGIPGSFACVSTINGVSSILVSIPGGGLFEVRHAGGDRYRVVELDRARMGQCDLTGEVQSAHQAQRRATKPTSGSTPQTAPASAPTTAAKAVENISGCSTNIYTLVDVLVAYTHQAFTNTTGTNAMNTRIEDGAAYCNAAFRNSGINLQVRIVGKMALPTNYVESGTLSTELTRAFSPGDGFMDELHGWRDSAGADLVCVMAEESDTFTIGIAYLLDSLSVAGNEAYGFSIVQRGFFSVTLAHELGHNLGCAHDRQNSSGPGLFSYSYGWRFQASGTYKTIMCYDPGTTIQNFSNPDIFFNGQPTGQPVGSSNEAHNAQTINISKDIVAQYRLPTVSTYAPCLALLTPTNNSTFGRNTAVTFTAEAGDDDGSIARVDFFFANTNIGTILGPSSNGLYSINFTMPNVSGTVPATFSVRATDNLGVTTSTQINSLINIVAPGNDKFTNAFTINGNNAAILGNNVDASREFGVTNEPSHAGNNGQKSVWWKWSTPVAGSTAVNTTNRAFQTVLAVYTGTNVLGGISVVASNINGGPVTFSAQSNVTYRIAVDGFRTGSVTEQGNFTLTLVGPALPSNAPPPSFTNTVAYMSNNAFNFLVTGNPGQNFILQVSTNLSNWFDYQTNTLPGSNLLLMDNLLTNVPHRFYRIRLP